MLEYDFTTILLITLCFFAVIVLTILVAFFSNGIPYNIACKIGTWLQIIGIKIVETLTRLYSWMIRETSIRSRGYGQDFGGISTRNVVMTRESLDSVFWEADENGEIDEERGIKIDHAEGVGGKIDKVKAYLFGRGSEDQAKIPVISASSSSSTLVEPWESEFEVV